MRERLRLRAYITSSRWCIWPGEDLEETSEKDGMERFTDDVASAIGIGKFKILRSLKEFKKSSMEYF